MDTAFEAGAVFGFKDTQTSVEQLAFGHDHDVEARGDLVSTEDLSYQSFCPVSRDGAPELFGRRNAETPHCTIVLQHEHRGVPSTNSGSPLVDLLELRAAMYPLVGPEPSQIYSLLTVRRFRPLARRRLSTSRPFFVCIRTRNPWVFRRWRVFGWNVRFPFIEIPWRK